MFYYRKNKLYCEDTSIEEIALSVGTPVYIYSKNAIVHNLKEYQKAFSSVPTLVCYAVKANSNYAILKTIFDCGAGADITSSGELYRVLNAGLSPQKIVFAGVGKSKEELDFAIRKKIFMLNIESVEELKLIDQLAGRLVSAGKSATVRSGEITHTTRNSVKIAIRVNPNIDPHTHKYITTGKQENKFGIPYEDAIEVFKFAHRECLNLTVAGIHCHIGSQIISIKPFEIMSRKIAILLQKLKRVGIKLEYVDIGGGLGIKYHNEKPPTPKELAKTVLSVLKPYKLKLIAEPGRYIVGNAGILLTKALYVKQGRQKKFVIVDAGMNDLIRPTLYGAYHEILPVTVKYHSLLTACRPATTLRLQSSARLSTSD
ncbi:MAG: diaminopimelate decarboxylase, partial [Elusimicrobiota bacterium]|nr:diaminopimelate decarboxylase [Elusimicrobiota bacterium]